MNLTRRGARNSTPLHKASDRLVLVVEEEDEQPAVQRMILTVAINIGHGVCVVAEVSAGWMRRLWYVLSMSFSISHLGNEVSVSYSEEPVDWKEKRTAGALPHRVRHYTLAKPDRRRMVQHC